MADIRAFRGVHYNKSLLKDWNKVICPPYDIIPPELHEELFLRSEYNFIRLEFNRDLPQDTFSDNKYTRAAAILEQWLKQSILVTDDKPAIYLYDQHFTLDGKVFTRRGMTVRIRLEEWEKMVVRPHEGTRSEAKSDRLNLIRALRANTSPILGMFQDKDEKIKSVFAAQAKKEPTLHLEIENGEGHNVWAITDLQAVKQITSTLANQPVYIADGHHRYESALNYKREKLAVTPTSTGEEPFNFAMMTLIDFADPGLVILPTHRVLRGIAKPVLAGFKKELQVFFELTPLSLKKADVWQNVDTLLEDPKETRLAVFGLEPEVITILRLKDPAAVAQMMPLFHSDYYKRLTLSVIDHVILEKLLLMTREHEKENLAFVYDRNDAMSKVSSGEYQLAFIISPVKPEIIKEIADIGDKMPRKSTYFYPKLPSGLIVNRLE